MNPSTGKTLALSAMAQRGYRAMTCGFMVVAIIFGVIAASARAHALDVPVAIGFDGSGDADTGGVVLSVDFDREARVAHQLLDHPWRLVMDFERIGYGFDGVDTSALPNVAGVRWGDMSETSSRLIFELESPAVVSELRWVDIANRDISRLEIELAAADADAFRAEMDRSLRTGAVVRTTTKADRLGTGAGALAKDDDFVIVLDPGHGGIDSGAIGARKTREKDITLNFSKELKARLEELDNIKVFMTRDSDVFIPLDDRVRFGRQHEASLFVSIHADSVRQDYVRGATVYTISDQASDAVAAQVARSENLSDEIAGIKVEEDDDGVVDILVDLARRETHGFSVQFARIAIGEIGEVARLIKNAHRYAGFRVLKAPDVPSVLVELGYLSNEQDEKLLNDPQWRSQIADSLVEAVARFAALSGHQLMAGN
jgi:N-acetylmuramoyl-L-alanine amidase